jgi:hypothetical protein
MLRKTLAIVSVAIQMICFNCVRSRTWLLLGEADKICMLMKEEKGDKNKSELGHSTAGCGRTVITSQVMN